jgi:hypothetical protein
MRDLRRFWIFRPFFCKSPATFFFRKGAMHENAKSEKDIQGGKRQGKQIPSTGLLTCAQGALKKQIDGALGWLVGSSEAKKVPGLVRFLCKIVYRVFELPSPRNAQKRDKRKLRKSVLDFLSISFVKTFRHDFVVNRFL